MPIYAPGSPLQKILGLARRVAPTDCNILVTGESGTGKEVVVRALHHWSQRARGPFVPVNCGAIPENLLESELFGHVKGAFTGAERPRTGRFEVANKGTVFLDEVGELPLLLQVKLLRVIQERRIEPLGSHHAKDVDFRLVAATNRSLESDVKDGKFREDLYFRLNVLRLHLPALRERPSDIPPLVEHFVRMYNDRLLTEIEGVSDDALNLLMRQSWKGNIRELENFIQGLMVIVGEGRIEMHHVHERLSQRIGFDDEPTDTSSTPLVNAALDFPEDGLDLNERLEQVETQLLAEALRRADGNKTKAARLLGLNRTTLVEKIKRKGMV